MQYTWTVPHDVQGYINLAGKKLFEKRLDDLFTVELPDDIPGAHDIPGAYRWLLAWQRTLPPHRLSVQLFRQTLEMPEVDQGDRCSFLWK